MAPPAYMCPPPTLSHTSSQPPRFDYFPHDLLMLTSPICPSLKFQKLYTIIQKVSINIRIWFIRYDHEFF